MEIVQAPTSSSYKRGRPKGGLVDMGALDLILVQPTYQGRPRRKRVQREIEDIMVLQTDELPKAKATDKLVKKRKLCQTTTSRINITRSSSKTPILKENINQVDERKNFKGQNEKMQSSTYQSTFFDNESYTLFSPSLVVVKELHPEDKAKRHQKAYEDLKLPEFDWRKPREDLYADRDSPLPLDLRDFQHTPRVMPKFKAKTEPQYLMELDVYEERRELLKRTEQRNKQKNNFPDESLKEMEALIDRFQLLSYEARTLISDIEKKIFN